MNSFEKYKNYAVEDFASDFSFIRWVKFSEEGENSFWRVFQEKYPAQVEHVSKARSIVEKLHVYNQEMTEEEVQRVWSNISKGVKEDSGSRKTASVRRFAPLWAAASIALVLAIGFYFVKERAAKEIVVEAPPLNGIMPGGDRAVLTLADGTQIVLDDADAGLLAQQDGSDVVKLKSGEISYGAAGAAGAEIQYNTITTPPGGQYQVTLPDGTKVWLNAESSLKFPTAFTGKQRKVELKGEGYFEVMRDASKSFHVGVKGINIEVLGTRFNVNAYEDEASVRTTLLQGSVAVGADNGKPVILKPGQQAVYHNSGGRLSMLNNIDVEEVVAWKNGYFSFQDASLEDVMKQISRWYDVDVRYEGIIEPRRFRGGISRDSNIDEVLKILERSRIHFKIEERTIIVKP